MLFHLCDHNNHDDHKIVCDDCHHFTPKQDPDPNSQCQGNPDCIIDEICAQGTTTSFYIGNLKYNNLGGMGPRFGDPPVIHYRNVGALNSRSLDMIVTTDSRYKNANFNYRWRAGWWI